MFDFAWPAISLDTIKFFSRWRSDLELPVYAPPDTGCSPSIFRASGFSRWDPTAARFASIPLLMFSAPFIIMRNTLRGRRIEGRRAEFVMVATVIAGLWSLMSGTVVVMALQMLLSA